MDYFFSKIGRSFRYLTTITGSLACGAIIIMGILGIQTIAIPICGGIALIPMAMVLIENTAIIRKLEKLMTKFKQDLDELRKINSDLSQNVLNLSNEIIDLKQIKENLVIQTNKLETLLSEAESKIGKLSDLSNNYKTNLELLKQSVQKSETNNNILKENIQELLAIKKEYESEISFLKINIESIEEQVVKLTTVKEEYEKQIQQFIQSNEQLLSTKEELKIELTKVKNCYEEAKDVISTLLRSKDVLNDIFNSMIKTEEKTDQNVSTLTKIMNIFKLQRSEELFNILDQNKDGTLTLEEFAVISEK